MKEILFLIRRICVFATLAFSCRLLAAGTESVHGLAKLERRVPEWLTSAVFCQIYPQSYCDSNGDGIGDLPGIIAKLDYIKSLGVPAIQFNPIPKAKYSCDWPASNSNFLPTMRRMVEFFHDHGIIPPAPAKN